MGELLKPKAGSLSADEQDSDKILKEALEERERLLEKSPRLNELQREIDRCLSKSGGIENRMAVIEIMQEARIEKCLQKLTLLLNVLKKIRSFFIPRSWRN